MPHDRRKPVPPTGRIHIRLDGMTIERRWPRLIHAMQWVAVLSSGEAESCIRDYLEGRPYSGEAVDHFGGTKAVLRAAARANVRSVVADQRRHTTERLTQVMKGLR